MSDRWNNIFSLDSLVHWLERKPADEGYSYINGRACMCYQYFSYMGLDVDRVSAMFYFLKSDPNHPNMYPGSFNKISLGIDSVYGPWTFGEALKRARNEIRKD